MNEIYSTLIQELHRYAKNHQFQSAVIGLSGGLNSSLALLIAVRTFGAKNVTALIMPEIGLTPQEDIEHSKALATHLGVTWHYQPINNFLVDYNFVSWDKTEHANENLKARVRSTLLHNFSEGNNAMIIGTASKSEITLGLGLLDGELAGHLHILGDLYKTDLFALASIMGLPTELSEKPCSRHLKPRQTDEDDLGAPWIKIDEILRPLTSGIDPEVLIGKGMDSVPVHKIARLVEQHKNITLAVPVIQTIRTQDAIKEARAAEEASLF